MGIDRPGSAESDAYLTRVVGHAVDGALGGPAQVQAQALITTPSGRVVPALPLTAAVPSFRRPFRRNPTTEPAPRWIGVLLGGLAVLFIPYIVVLGVSLPDHATAAHYDAAWVGLDVMELVALGATAWFAWTRSTWIALSSTAAATFLLCDAWFDVVTTRGDEHRLVAIASALLVELPLAAFCVWIARHAEVVHERATLMLLHRSASQAARLRTLEERVSDTPSAEVHRSSR